MKMKEIKCDKCGAEFEARSVVIKNRVIAQDEKRNEVIEKFFECPACGEKYRVTVMDRKQMLLIQERVKTQRRYERAAKNRQLARAKTYFEKEKELAETVKERARMLKEKYKEN